MDLIDRIKRKRIERRSGFTLFDDVFIPMFIGSEEEMQALRDGKLTLKPAVDVTVLPELLANIPKGYIGVGEWDAIKNGGYANLAELLAKQTAMYPLFYGENTYKRPAR